MSSISVVLFLCFIKFDSLQRDYWLHPLLPMAELDLPFCLISYNPKLFFYFRTSIRFELTADCFDIAAYNFVRAPLYNHSTAALISTFCFRYLIRI